MARAYVGCFGKEKGIVVPVEDAYEYAKDHLDELAEEDRNEFVEWFFSGNFIEKEVD